MYKQSADYDDDVDYDDIYCRLCQVTFIVLCVCCVTFIVLGILYPVIMYKQSADYDDDVDYDDIYRQ